MNNPVAQCLSTITNIQQKLSRQCNATYQAYSTYRQSNTCTETIHGLVYKYTYIKPVVLFWNVCIWSLTGMEDQTQTVKRYVKVGAEDISQTVILAHTDGSIL